MIEPLVAIHDLTVDFTAMPGWPRAVDGISLELAPGQSLGIVGESARARASPGWRPLACCRPRPGSRVR